MLIEIEAIAVIPDPADRSAHRAIGGPASSARHKPLQVDQFGERAGAPDVETLRLVDAQPAQGLDQR